MVNKYKYIDADLSSTKYCGFDDFMRALGVDPELYQKDDETIWKIASDKTTLQLRNEYCKDIRRNTQRYGPFCELANHIISQLPSQSQPIVFCRNDPHYIKGVFGNDRKPDLVVLKGEDPAVANEKWREHSSIGPRGISWTWTDVLHTFEFKVRKAAIDYKNVNVLLPSDAVLGGKADAIPQANIPSSSAPADAPPPVKSASATISSVVRTDVEQFEAVMNQPWISSRASSKRKHMLDEDGPDMENPNSSKKARRRGPRRDLMKQAARYAVDKLWFDLNLRHTISGLIDDGDLRMCYYDHAGIVCSRRLHFVDDLYRFVLLIKILVELSPEDRGIMENMRRIIAGDDTDETSSFDEDIESNAVSSDLTSLPDEDSPDSNPELDAPEWLVKVGRHKVLVHDSLCRSSHSLLGRAKRVDVATCESLNPTKPNQIMVIETSWPAARLMSEVHITMRARDVLDKLDKDIAFRMRHGIEPERKLSDCLPKVLACDDLENLGDSGFRKRLGASFEDNRICRTIVFDVLLPIYEVEDLSVFKRLFREIVQGHHFLSTSSPAIKHCDIGLLNVMYRILPDGTLRGVLNDWDLAEVGDSDEKDAKVMRMDTQPFMAIDLLEADPPKHIERFDWESIFYVLVWICCHYSDGYEIESTALDRWLEHDLTYLNDTKSAFLSTFFFDKITDHFKPLVFIWLWPLQKLFRDGYSAKWVYRLEASFDNEASLDKEASFDFDTLGGHVTYDKMWRIFEKD
ncbi:hypothetical protein M0805_001255 [Coniferiporia weirii]|nr:hypothetical protein M0805_001255 [Coniferiporia weirii]